MKALFLLSILTAFLLGASFGGRIFRPIEPGAGLPAEVKPPDAPKKVGYRRWFEGI